MTSRRSADKTKDSKASTAAGSDKQHGSSDDDANPPVYASDVVAMVKQHKQKKKPGKTANSAATPGLLPDRVGTLERESLGLSELPDDVPLEQRPALVLRMAEEAFAKTGSWVIFYREMMGCHGIVSQLYPSNEERRYFESTPEFAELLEMLAAIRSQDDAKAGAHEPDRVITVRMPRSLHEATIREADELGLSINNYCLTKLLQPANAKFTPVESGKRRGRRPGPQITVERVKLRNETEESPKQRKTSKRAKR